MSKPQCNSKRRRMKPSPSECNICNVQGELLRPTSKCEHEAATCLACIKQSLGFNLVGGSLAICNDIANIPCCGGFSCTEAFQESDLRKYLTTLQISKWSDLVFNSFAKKQPDFRWCAKPSCGSGQFIDSSDGGDVFFRCHKCKTMTCIKHRIVMHEGLTCAQYEETSTDFSRSCDEIAKTSKPCPSCGESVEKSHGCDHMTCFCGYQFCYSCLADWKSIINNDNSYHHHGCPWYFPAE